MRQIKLRAFDSVNKEFVYVIVTQGVCVIEAVVNSGAKLEPWGLFIGLLDKNGKEIYEGDVLKTEYGTYAVEYDAPEFQLTNYDHYGVNGEGFYGWEISEVIGNIYESPELLK